MHDIKYIACQITNNIDHLCEIIFKIKIKIINEWLWNGCKPKCQVHDSLTIQHGSQKFGSK